MARLDVASKALHYQVLPKEGQVLGFRVFEKGVVQSNNALTQFPCHVVILSRCLVYVQTASRSGPGLRGLQPDSDLVAVPEVTHIPVPGESDR